MFTRLSSAYYDDFFAFENSFNASDGFLEKSKIETLSKRANRIGFKVTVDVDHTYYTSSTIPCRSTNQDH